jgi:hypothetical protein
MSHRWGRWALVVVAVAIAAAACTWALGLEGQLRAARQTQQLAASHAGNARTALGDVRRGLAAMASPGQAAVGWSRRAVAGIDDTRAEITALAVATGHREAPRPSLDELERLGEAERRLRDHAVGGKPLMAADVAFGEALPHVDELERQITEALAAATTTADREVAMLRDRQVAALAGALATLLLAALVLTPLPAGRTAAVVPEARAATTPDPLADLPLATAVVAAPVPPAAPLPVIAVAPAAVVDLPALAAVCADLAAVADAGALPATLERAAAAIGARGLIVWLADADRRHLRVAAATGYDARLLDRLGAVDVADDNPTARAFSTGALVTADARGGHAAAAAVPLIGPAGIGGVLAAELAASDPAGQAASTAAARVIAAQLTTLVAPAAEAAVPAPADGERLAQG